jgi:glycosyltransferase involved in cell wall biosynthesis
MLRLAIDLSSFLHGKAAGFNEYALCLVQGMAEVPQSELQLTLFVRPGQRPHFRAVNPSATIREIPFRGDIGRLLWHHFGPARIAGNHDAFLFPANFVPLLVPDRSFLVVHDLNFLVNRRSFGALNMAYRHLIQRRSIRRCNAVISISDATASEVEAYAGRASEVIHNPVRLRALPGVATEHLLLCPSSLSHHKNIPAAHRACLRLVDEDPRLTVAFIGNWRPEEFPATRLHPRIRLLGFVDDAERARLLAACKAVFAPSWYEGFGMPYIEALASGKALICSDIPVAREVAGDCAYWIAAPHGEHEILESLRQANAASFAPKRPREGLLERYAPGFAARRYVQFISSVVGHA